MTRSIPLMPLVLGLAGLIPFWALAIMLDGRLLLGFTPASVDLALATYAAIIISFLGGIRWGLAAVAAPGRSAQFAFSVAPSLLVWALLLAPEPWRLAGLGATALALGPIDARMVSEGLAPVWLARLRLILSTAAGAALLLAAVGAARS